MRSLTRIWASRGSVGLCLALAYGGVGCALRMQGGDTEEADDQHFIVGRFAFKRLEEVDKAIAEQRFADARATLAELGENEDLNPHEQALMWQSLGQVQAMEKQYAEAAHSFEKCLALNALPDEARAGIEFNLGQMYMVEGDYAKAITALNAYLDEGKPATPQIHQMLAGAYVQEEQYEKALPHALAILEAENPQSESSLQLMLAVRVELKQFPEAIAVLKTLIHEYPKKAYWLQLSAAYAQAGDNARALATLEVAHHQKFLTEEAEIMQLVSRYLNEGIPRKGAELLQQSLDSGQVAKTPRHLELLANAWMASREIKRALQAMETAAEAAEGGGTYLRLAQLLVQEEQWSRATTAASRAISKGALEDPGTAYLLLGMARYHSGERAGAEQAFGQASAHDNARASAQQWLDTMRREQDSCPTGKEAACALVPGLARKR